MSSNVIDSSINTSPDIDVSSTDIEIYDDDIAYYLNDYIESRGLDRNKIPSTQWAAAMLYIGKNVFKRNPKLLKDPSGTNGQYDLSKVDRLADRYIYMCYDYNQRVCVEHFCFLSGISYDTIYSWRNNKARSFVYMDCNNNIVPFNSAFNPDKMGLRKVASYSAVNIYKKLINNTMLAADDLVLSKSGVNSIAYRNAMVEKYASRQEDSPQGFDMTETALQLGISDQLAITSRD